MLRTLRDRLDERGMALITVLLVMSILFVLLLGLLFQADTEQVVAVNEMDHVKALAYADAGVEWVEKRLTDATNYSDVLNGPNNGSTGDDNLIGIRSLTLTATTQFTTANESTASAIVARDFFGTGSRNYEVLRLADDTNSRAHLYVRVEDNFDDAPDNPAANAPLTDTDGRLRATIVAEYPVFVGTNGVETTSRVAERGAARRSVVVTFGGTQAGTAAITADGDLDILSTTKICGACGSVHTNANLNLNNPAICGDATASGTFSKAGSTTIGGTSGGSKPQRPVPVISPYSNVLVPAATTFNYSADTSIPARLRCQLTASDPGASKYFAFVADASKGKVFKAYWNFTTNRWQWKLIDDLNDGTDVVLDDCGRAPGDANYPAAANDRVADGVADEFYGFKPGGATTNIACTSCASSAGDQSLCTLANNDQNRVRYYNTAGTLVTGAVSGSSIPVFPGSFDPDGVADFAAATWVKDGIWNSTSDRVWSPLYGAVIWVYGSLILSHNHGNSSSIDWRCSTNAACTSGTLPNNLWRVSFISYSDIQLNGNGTYGPASPNNNYHFLLVAGRDLAISGNPAESVTACGGSCPSSTPSNIANLGGIYAAHEQIQLNGNPNVYGFLMAENAIDCSTTVSGAGRGVSTINGTPKIFYDCSHPPNPWATAATLVRSSWEEVE